jgi:hypothetical protein
MDRRDCVVTTSISDAGGAAAGVAGRLADFRRQFGHRQFGDRRH